MQRSVKLEQMLKDWSHNTGDDASVLGTQKFLFLLHTFSRISFPQSYRIFMDEKSTLSFMLVLVHFIQVILSFFQSQEHNSCCTLQFKGPSGQSSVPTVVRDKCMGKSNKRLSIRTSSPNSVLSPQLFSGWRISWVRCHLFI